ncbi:hypothetical protein [Nostoc sp.]|uniref:hypothetical protein n=1 Tax=Nostoc sp. TaxID=1180 RepID=UPI0035936CDF
MTSPRLNGIPLHCTLLTQSGYCLGGDELCFKSTECPTADNIILPEISIKLSYFARSLHVSLPLYETLRERYRIGEAVRSYLFAQPISPSTDANAIALVRQCGLGVSPSGATTVGKLSSTVFLLADLTKFDFQVEQLPPGNCRQLPRNS